MKSADIKGGNGNIFFDIENQTATKYLRNTSSHEKIERFKLEQEVLSSVSNERIPNIVEILEIYIDSQIEKSFIKMRKYDGSLQDLFDITKGNVKLTLELILPIIKTLKLLSEHNPQIYHRDLKPDNILYKKDNEKYELYLTDFGTCFLKNNDERITPEKIAVGARMFLAPEYEIGRVENVDEKGDIFSIGKIIWCMINGEKDALLPSNFWFIDDYDLSKKFFDKKDIISANHIIASCLNINPIERVSYEELINLINNVLNEDYTHEIVEKQIRVKLFQERRKIELVEILKKNKLIVNQFSIVFLKALEKLINIYPEFYILEKIYSNYSKKSSNGTDFTTSNIDNNSSHYLYSSSFDNMYLSINYHPARLEEKYAHISIEYHINSNRKNNKMLIKYDSKGVIICEYDNLTNIFSESEMIKFIDNLIMDYID